MAETFSFVSKRTPVWSKDDTFAFFPVGGWRLVMPVRQVYWRIELDGLSDSNLVVEPAIQFGVDPRLKPTFGSAHSLASSPVVAAGWTYGESVVDVSTVGVSWDVGRLVRPGVMVKQSGTPVGIVYGSIVLGLDGRS